MVKTFIPYFIGIGGYRVWSRRRGGGPGASRDRPLEKWGLNSPFVTDCPVQ